MKGNDFKGIYINGDTYMTKNIPREIINAFSCIDNELSVCSDELPKIFNYITDLQEDNDYLKKRNNFLNSACNGFSNKNKDLQTRIDKAKDYLETCMINPEDLSLYENITKEECLKLLDILRGEE